MLALCLAMPCAPIGRSRRFGETYCLYARPLRWKHRYCEQLVSTYRWTWRYNTKTSTVDRNTGTSLQTRLGQQVRPAGGQLLARNSGHQDGSTAQLLHVNGSMKSAANSSATPSQRPLSEVTTKSCNYFKSDGSVQVRRDLTGQYTLLHVRPGAKNYFNEHAPRLV